MKKFFRFLSISFVFMMTIAGSTVGLAHSGKTDSKGGHKDKKNISGLGSYHYHHGYSAHLHENGVCPYNDSSSSSKSKNSNSSSKSSSTTFVTTQDTKLYSKADKESESLGNVSEGTTITAIDKTEYFVKAKVNGKTGYIRMKHLKAK